MSHPAEHQPLVLAIDTSTTQAGIALYNGDLVAELSWPAGRHGSQSLLSEIDHLLSLVNLTVDRLTAVSVAIGPGSFSALRVGLSVAKGLCFALGCPLLGIPTLDAVAHPHRHLDHTVWAVLDAGRQRVVTAPYAATATGWQAIAAAVHGPAAGLLECVCGPALICGEFPPAIGEALAAMPGVAVLSPANRRRRAGAVAELAWARLLSNQPDDPITLEPLYLHANVSPP